MDLADEIQRYRSALLIMAAAAAALTLSACGEKDAPEPQNEVTGAAMPDTGQFGPNPPDAGATGTVPASGDVPVQPTGPSQPQQKGLPPVDLPAVGQPK